MWNFDDDSYPGTWTQVDSPVKSPLHDVTQTANGPAAVGGTGKVIGRTPDGTWGVLVENGPGGKSRRLHVVDATDDGTRLYFAGAGGALGTYDLETGERTDFSGVEGLNGTIGALTVAGDRGSEKLLLADTSGNVVPAYANEDGQKLNVDYGFRPAGDTAIKAMASGSDGVGYAVDNNTTVYKTGREGFVEVGVADADNTMYAAHVDPEAVLIAGANGFVYEMEADGRWTPHNLGNFAVRAITRRGDEMLAGGSSRLRYRRGNGNWVDVGWEGGSKVTGVVIGSEKQADIAVCANGAIIEGHHDSEKAKERRGDQNDEDGPAN